MKRETDSLEIIDIKKTINDRRSGRAGEFNVDGDLLYVPYDFISKDGKALSSDNYSILDGVSHVTAYRIFEYFRNDFVEARELMIGDDIREKLKHLSNIDNPKINKALKNLRDRLDGIIDERISEVKSLQGNQKEKFFLTKQKINTKTDLALQVHYIEIFAETNDQKASWEKAWEGLCQIVIDDLVEMKNYSLIKSLISTYENTLEKEKTNFKNKVLTPKSIGSLLILAYDKLFNSLENNEGKSLLKYWVYIDKVIPEINPFKEKSINQFSETGKRLYENLESARAISAESRKKKASEDKDLRVKFAIEKLNDNHKLSSRDLAKLYRLTPEGEKFTTSTLINYFGDAKSEALKIMLKKK